MDKNREIIRETMYKYTAVYPSEASFHEEDDNINLSLRFGIKHHTLYTDLDISFDNESKTYSICITMNDYTMTSKILINNGDVFDTLLKTFICNMRDKIYNTMLSNITKPETVNIPSETKKSSFNIGIPIEAWSDNLRKEWHILDLYNIDAKLEDAFFAGAQAMLFNASIINNIKHTDIKK